MFEGSSCHVSSWRNAPTTLTSNHPDITAEGHRVCNAAGLQPDLMPRKHGLSPRCKKVPHTALATVFVPNSETNRDITINQLYNPCRSQHSREDTPEFVGAAPKERRRPVNLKNCPQREQPAREAAYNAPWRWQQQQGSLQARETDCMSKDAVTMGLANN